MNMRRIDDFADLGRAWNLFFFKAFHEKLRIENRGVPGFIKKLVVDSLNQKNVTVLNTYFATLNTYFAHQTGL